VLLSFASYRLRYGYWAMHPVCRASRGAHDL